MLTEYDDEQGVCVPYPDDEVSDATDQRLPPTSALLKKENYSTKLQNLHRLQSQVNG